MELGGSTLLLFTLPCITLASTFFLLREKNQDLKYLMFNFFFFCLLSFNFITYVLSKSNIGKEKLYFFFQAFPHEKKYFFCYY